MNRYNLKIVNVLVGACFVSIYVSCTKPSTSMEHESSYKSKSYRLIQQNIEKMVSQPWNKSAYQEIKDKQILMLKKNSEQKSASTLLETEYSKQMLRDANEILQGGCAAPKSHELLDMLLKELAAYPNVPGLSDVKVLKGIHEEADRFVRSAVGRQKVLTYRESYDKNHENRKIAQARRYLGNSQIKCNALKKDLQNLSHTSAYNSRRKAYCMKIVELYLQCTTAEKRELNAAKANLNVYNGKEISSWKEQMDAHYEELIKLEEQKNENI